MKTEETVMFDSPEAAQLRKVEGWVSKDGRFYGNDERTARYAGCTHRKCENCDNTVRKDRIICDSCQAVKMAAKYAALEAREWDGVTPLSLYDGDEYFFDWESVEEYAEDHDCKVEDLQLVLCRPVKPRQLDANDLFCDELPEDGECPDAVVEAVERLNQAIREAGPFSWYSDKYRVIIKEAGQ